MLENLTPFKNKYKDQPLIKVSIPIPHRCSDDCGGLVYKATREYAIQVSNTLEEEIIKSICNIAKECGITDLVILNKEFIISALQHEIERRKHDKR